MSDTPRVDAIPKRGPFHHWRIEDVFEEARKLERELTALREAVAGAPHAHNCASFGYTKSMGPMECNCFKSAAELAPQHP